eukprot:6207092-Pleurochrysis_carterae.AAC.2
MSSDALVMTWQTRPRATMRSSQLQRVSLRSSLASAKQPTCKNEANTSRSKPRWMQTASLCRSSPQREAAKRGECTVSPGLENTAANDPQGERRARSTASGHSLKEKKEGSAPPCRVQPAACAPPAYVPARRRAPKRCVLQALCPSVLGHTSMAATSRLSPPLSSPSSNGPPTVTPPLPPLPVSPASTPLPPTAPVKPSPSPPSCRPSARSP